MKRLIYTSIAGKEISFDAVNDLLTIAIPHNKEKAITGVLVFNGTAFMQCIEGEDVEIDSLFAKISMDNRHCDIHILGSEEIVERMFSNWNMGYLNSSNIIKNLSEEILGSYSPIFQNITYKRALLFLNKAIKMI